MMFTKSNCNCFTFTLLFVLLAGATGCQLFPERPEWSKNLLGKEEEAVVPTRMMVMWTDTVLHQPQKSGVRGFGARIYFYSENDPNPVKVDGGLAVYAFDAKELNPNSAEPKRKFVFTADQFAEYMSHTSMGTSYSVWCPWDEVGGYNEQLSLIVRFEGRNGGVVISDATVKLLPGLNEPTPLADSSPGTIAQASASSDTGAGSTKQAGFEKPSHRPRTSRPPRRQTETIDLPPSFYRHLQGPKPQSPAPPAPLASSLVEQALGEQEPQESQGSEQVKEKSEAENEAPKDSAASSSQSTQQLAPYPRRTLGEQQASSTSNEAGHHSFPLGWIPKLPKTPRYGYPNSPPESR